MCSCITFTVFTFTFSLQSQTRSTATKLLNSLFSILVFIKFHFSPENSQNELRAVQLASFFFPKKIMTTQVNERHAFQLDIAFAELKRQGLENDEEMKLALVTSDFSTITTSSSTLLFFSPWLRNIVSSLPCSSR